MSSSELPDKGVHKQDFRGLPGKDKADMQDSTRPSVVFAPGENIIRRGVILP